MVGSHDSMTFMRARYRFMELFTILWRTQTRDLTDQAMAGVRYFDIRVRRDKGMWILCHGLVDLDKVFSSLDKLIEYVDILGSHPGLGGRPYIRLILERGDSLEFETAAPRLAEKFPGICFIAIKRGWRVLLNRDPEIVDMTFVPWLSDNSFKENMKRLWQMIRSGKPLSIAAHARSNPEIDPEMVRSETVYFLDRV